MRRLLFLCWIALAAAPLAQTSQFVLSSQDRARLLAVDFTATLSDGTPVTDLRPDEVTIRVGNRDRAIGAFDFIRPAASTALSGLAPAFGDNAEPPRTRSVIFAIDEDTIRPGRTLDIRDAVQQVLQGLSAGDRGALVTVPFGGLAVDLTTDHTRLVQAVGQVTAKSQRGESTADAQCRTLTTLTSLTDLLLRLSQVEDPVTVVFFSSHQETPQSIIRMTGSAPVGGPCDLRADTFTALGSAAARARAQFFIIHADLEQRGRGLAGLEHIAGVTGGTLVHLSTDAGRAATRRVLSQTAGHYLARVSRDPEDPPGELLPVSITVRRPGVRVWRTPRLLVTRPTGPAPTRPGAPVSLPDLIRQPNPARELPLRLAGHVFRSDAATATLKVAITLDSPNVSVTPVDAIVGVFDRTGGMAAGIELTTAALTSRPVLAAIDVTPGVYRLRAAVRDAEGRTGSVDFPLEAQLTAIGRLSASSLMVGLSRAGAFVPMLEFSAEPVAFALLELYGDAARSAKVVFELAATPMGPATLTTPGRVEATADSTRVVVTAALPIQGLAPGDYIVRATVTPDGAPGGRVVRAIRKTPFATVR